MNDIQQINSLDHPGEVSGVSVVIPLYNKKNTVSRAIESLLKQEGTPKEIIVIDDGSTDGSGEIAKAYGDSIRYFRQNNQGPSAARNYGVGLSRFPLLVFLDADDELMAGCLAAHMQCRRQRPDTKLSLVPFHIADSDGTSRSEHFRDRFDSIREEAGLYYTDGFHAELVFNVASGAIGIDKELFKAIGGFDVRLQCWEITDLMLRAALHSPTTCIAQNCSVVLHEDKMNSQFARTQGDKRFLAQFAHNIMDLLAEIPKDQRELVQRQIIFILYGLARANSVSHFKSVAQRCCKRKWAFNRKRKFCLLSKMPSFLLALAFFVREIRSPHKLKR